MLSERVKRIGIIFILLENNPKSQTMVRTGGSAAPSSPQHHISTLLQPPALPPRRPSLSTPPALPPLHPQCRPCGSMPSRDWLAARTVYKEPGSFLPLIFIYPPSSTTPLPRPSPLLPKHGDNQCKFDCYMHCF